MPGFFEVKTVSAMVAAEGPGAANFTTAIDAGLVILGFEGVKV